MLLTGSGFAAACSCCRILQAGAWHVRGSGHLASCSQHAMTDRGYIAIAGIGRRVTTNCREAQGSDY